MLNPMRAIALLGVLLLAACSGSARSSPVVASPAPSGSVLVTFSGTGDGTSPAFAGAGGQVTLAYHYDTCTTGVTSEDGIGDNAMRINEAVEFVVTLAPSQTASSVPSRPVVDDEAGLSRSETLGIALPSGPGPYQVHVASTCQWTLTLTGQP